MTLLVKCSLCTDVSYFLCAERRDVFSFWSKETGDVCFQAKCSVDSDKSLTLLWFASLPEFSDGKSA